MKKKLLIFLLFLLIANSNTVSAYGYNTEDDILITVDKTEMTAGDTVTAIFEKLNSEITILGATWNENWIDGGHESGAIHQVSSADLEQGISTHSSRKDCTCSFEIIYQGVDGSLHTAKSDWVVVHGYIINTSVTGYNENTVPYSVEAGQTITVDYEITGGYDDFEVYTSWMIDIGSSFTTVDEQISYSRFGTISYTPASETDAITFSIRIKRAGDIYTSVSRTFQVVKDPDVRPDDEHNTEDDIMFTIDNTEITAGDAVTATFEKLDSEIILLGATWNENWIDGTHESGATYQVSSAELEQGISTHFSRKDCTCYFEIVYQAANEIIYTARSNPVVVHGYIVNTSITGYNENTVPYSVEAGQTITVDYDITGGYDDFEVHTFWMIDIGSSFTTSDEQISHSRFGTIAYTPTNVTDTITFSIRIKRGEDYYTSVSRTYQVIPKPDMILPASLTTVETDAFSGTSFSCVRIPENVILIAENAFSNCTNLRYIYIMNPSAVIDPFAFGEETSSLTFYGNYLSTARQWALEHGCRFISIG